MLLRRSSRGAAVSFLSDSDEAFAAAIRRTPVKAGVATGLSADVGESELVLAFDPPL